MRIDEVTDLSGPHLLRRRVFIEEQGYSEAEEWDDLDAQARHLLASEAGRPLGTARIFVEGETGRIGRVCVLAETRGTGLGAELIRAALVRLTAAGCTRVVLGAQVRAMGFYEKLGFTACGADYDDGGVPHREMEWRA